MHLGAGTKVFDATLVWSLLEFCIEWKSRSVAEFPFAAQRLPKSMLQCDIMREKMHIASVISAG